MIRHGCRAAVAALSATLVFAGSAGAQELWRPVPQGCVSGATPDPAACKPLRGASGTWQVAVAPGGLHAYAIAWRGYVPGSSPPVIDPTGNSLVIFDRNPSTGVLTQRGAGGCLSETGSNGDCVKARGLMQPTGIVVSPDGNQVYVASNAPGGVATFDRNPVTGDLVQKPGLNGCMSNDGTTPGTGGAVCADGRALPVVDTLAISPDGRTVFAGAGPIAVLQRNPDTGVLTQPAGNAGCVEETPSEGCADGHGLSSPGFGARQLGVSADGRSLYVPTGNANSLAVFDRDPNSGLITQKDGAPGCIGLASNGGTCAILPQLNFPRAVSVSPDGGHVYVSVADGLLQFYRLANGTLGLQSCVNDSGNGGCRAGANLLNMTFNAVSPDGQTIVASVESNGNQGAYATQGGFSKFDRDASGNLVQPRDACVSFDGGGWVHGARVPAVCQGQMTMQGHGSVSFVDDGSLIVASHYGSSIVSFKRDFYPVCANRTVTVTQNVVAAVPFACADRNGDALTYEVTSEPSSGVRGAVDQPASRVFYNPFANFVGRDSFTYRASAGGVLSNSATVNLDVVAAPVTPPPPPKIETVDAGISYRWSYGKVNFTIRRLVARGLPVGSTFSITCSGKKCPYRSKTIKRSRKSTMNVLRAKTLKRKVTFRAGQTVEFRVAAPLMNTKVLRFRLKSRKQPDHQTYCIPLGKRKAQRTC